jgi:hypothetical protein
MTPKRPRDPNQLAKSIVDIATGEKPNPPPKKPTSGQSAKPSNASSKAK